MRLLSVPTMGYSLGNPLWLESSDELSEMRVQFCGGFHKLFYLAFQHFRGYIPISQN
jgi:hypothetical protein